MSSHNLVVGAMAMGPGIFKRMEVYDQHFHEITIAKYFGSYCAVSLDNYLGYVNRIKYAGRSC